MYNNQWTRSHFWELVPPYMIMWSGDRSLHYLLFQCHLITVLPFPHHQHWSPSLFHTGFHLFYTGPHLSLSLNLYRPCPHPQPVPCLRMQQPKDLRTSLILNRLKHWSNKLLRCTTMSRPSLLVLIKAYVKSVRRSVISTLLPHYNV